MKKLILILTVSCLISTNSVYPQGLLNKVKSAVSKEIGGNKSNNTSNNQANTQPEPKCACNDPKFILDLSRFKIPYSELSLCYKDDGSILVLDRVTGKFYISKDGNLEGPYEATDKKVTDFKEEASCETTSQNEDENNNKDYWLNKYPSWIFKTGDKYLIKFAGKTYGPYALISEFAVPKSNDKFAAMVTENVVSTDADNKKMEEAMKNAKSDQERMELAMKYSQQMTKQITEGGGPNALLPTLVSNVPGAKYDQMAWMGGKLNGSVKYDEIVVVSSQKVVDLQSRTIFTTNDSYDSSKPMFLNSSDTKSARYIYGSLVFSDNTTLPDLFNPYLIRVSGKTFLTYMYYSPSRNAIMQCQIPF